MQFSTTDLYGLRAHSEPATSQRFSDGSGAAAALHLCASSKSGTRSFEQDGPHCASDQFPLANEHNKMLGAPSMKAGFRNHTLYWESPQHKSKVMSDCPVTNGTTTLMEPRKLNSSYEIGQTSEQKASECVGIGRPTSKLTKNYPSTDVRTMCQTGMHDDQDITPNKADHSVTMQAGSGRSSPNTGESDPHEGDHDDVNSLLSPPCHIVIPSTIEERIAESALHGHKNSDCGLPSGPLSANSSRSEEISATAVDEAVQYFELAPNTSHNFSINLLSDAATSWNYARPWTLLETLHSVTWNNRIYTCGDIIYVRVGIVKPSIEIFEIAEIRSLGDARSVMRGFWYYTGAELAGRIPSKEVRPWCRKTQYVKSTHMDVIMWNCATGVLSEDEMGCIVRGKICNMATKAWKIEDETAADVCWALTRG